MSFRYILLFLILNLLISCNGGGGGGVTSGGGTTGGNGNGDNNIPEIDLIPWFTQFGVDTKAGGDNTANDHCYGVTVDTAGNVYCAGGTASSMSETSGGRYDAFVTKLDPRGNVVWHTQLGDETNTIGNSSEDDFCSSVAVDSSGNVYCAGYTWGSLGEGFAGGVDAFILKLNSSGNIVWLKHFGLTTTLGGNNLGNDVLYGVAVDGSGNVYAAGSTDGAMGSEPNGGNSRNDAVIIKLNSSGNLVWIRQLGQNSTFNGGNNSGIDYCNSIAVDSDGYVYCGGATNSDMADTLASANKSDALILKLNPNGTINWIKQFGTNTIYEDEIFTGDNSGNDTCNGVAVDLEGNVYCGGQTTGNMSEVNGGNSQNDAFIMKLDPDGDLVWHTQFGDTTNAGGTNAAADSCLSVAVDSSGNSYCSGSTRDGMSEGFGGPWSDAFVMKLNPNGNLVWHTQFGNTTNGGGTNSYADSCLGVAVDTKGNVYCAGETRSGMSEANAGGVNNSDDIFIFKLNPDGEIN